MTSFLTQVLGSGTGQYLADQYGNPWLCRGDSLWGLAVNAGVNGGATTWESDIALYMSTRASQGFNATIIDGPCGNDITGIDSDGNTWDGVSPWSPSMPTMNSSWWERLDLCVSTAETYGITVFLNGADAYALNGGSMNGMTPAQATTYGTALAGRYASALNVVWLFGNDYNGSYDSIYTNILAALRAGGADQLVTIENLTEGDSRFSDYTGDAWTWGTSNAQLNFVYSYGGFYPCINYAYKEASPAAVLLGDGWYDGTGYSTLPSDPRDFMRILTWWCLTSGSRGYIYGRGGPTGTDLWAWNSGASAGLTTNTFDNTDLNNIWNAYAALPGWWELVPDTGNVFVTGERGTALPIAQSDTGASYTGYSGGTDIGSRSWYVTASITPSGSLAVLYLPDATGTENGGPVTINTSKMAPGYTAHWMDPVTGALTSTAAGSSYSTEMTNSLGENDWVLVLQGPADPVTGTGPPLYGFRS